MEKNWLIRSRKATHSQIVGPVSRAKILELMEAKVLSPDVELCAGNGYWFWIKEEELFKKYVVRGEPQEFNPISEVLPVLGDSSEETEVAEKQAEEASGNLDITLVGGIDLSALHESNKQESLECSRENTVLPDESDLEYPDLGNIGEISVQAGVSVTTKESNDNVETSETAAHLDKNIHLPPPEDLEYPDVGSKQNLNRRSEEARQSKSKTSRNSNIKENPLKKRKRRKPDRRERPKPKRNDRLLLIFIAMIFMILTVIAYIYLKLNHFVTFSNHLIPVAQAQEVKKKELR